MNRKKLVIKTVREAGEIIMKSVPTSGLIEKVGHGNFVTDADLASEKLIINLIKENFPSDDILSEETHSTLKNPLSKKGLWVIDPIDGTNNFRYERNYSAVSIAYIEKGVLKIGAIYNPFRDELFFAESGKGACLNNNKMKANKVDDLSNACIATDNSAFSKGTKKNLKMLIKLDPIPMVFVRGSAVLAMCDVACGRLDLYFHTYLKPWDNAAAFLIAKESGLKVCGLKGEEINFMSEEAIVGNKILSSKFVSCL
jgi:myo-inositol-1(or 4)-monophosphatase